MFCKYVRLSFLCIITPQILLTLTPTNVFGIVTAITNLTHSQSYKDVSAGILPFNVFVFNKNKVSLLIVIFICRHTGFGSSR